MRSDPATAAKKLPRYPFGTGRALGRWAIHQHFQVQGLGGALLADVWVAFSPAPETVDRPIGVTRPASDVTLGQNGSGFVIANGRGPTLRDARSASATLATRETPSMSGPISRD
jgi:hypothetical protein